VAILAEKSNNQNDQKLEPKTKMTFGRYTDCSCQNITKHSVRHYWWIKCICV